MSPERKKRKLVSDNGYVVRNGTWHHVIKTGKSVWLFVFPGYEQISNKSSVTWKGCSTFEGLQCLRRGSKRSINEMKAQVAIIHIENSSRNIFINLYLFLLFHIQSFAHPFIHSFARSFVHSFVHSFINESFIYSIINSFFH